MKRKNKKRKLFPLHAYIIAALRRIWRWHPARKEALEKSSVNIVGRDPLFKCASCRKILARKMVQIDHVSPVIAPKDKSVKENELRRGKDAS